MGNNFNFFFSILILFIIGGCDIFDSEKREAKLCKDNLTEVYRNTSLNNFEKEKFTFFEMSVALAFWYFSKVKVDYAIIEVGLGGRLDATNIITPVLSIITNIGLDHTQFLGKTHVKIAFEKAGIIKSEIPIIIGENDIKTK